jgi:OmpA-OmpF porin, OOP family
MKQVLLPVAAAVSLALPLAAGAQMMSRDSQASGPYVGADIGQSKFRDGCGGFSGCDDKDTSWRVFGGYQLNRNFAAEVGYTDFGSVAANAPGASSTADSHAWELTGVGMIPIVGGLSAYGKLGGYYGRIETSGTVGAVPVSASETNTGLTYGLGAQYDFTKNLGLRAQWQRYNNVGGNSTGETDIDAMTVGVLFRFQ